MQSNSKLTTQDKEYLKVLKINNPDVKLVNNANTTIAYLELGNTVEFTLSVMSDNEKKFRRKVGEYHALTRFNNGQTVKMGCGDFLCMLANIYGHYL